MYPFICLFNNGDSTCLCPGGSKQVFGFLKKLQVLLDSLFLYPLRLVYYRCSLDRRVQETIITT